MRYLGLDFGTVWTKACIYDTDTEMIQLINMDDDTSDHADFELIGGKYACPTAVFIGRDEISKVGKEAVRSRFINPLRFYNMFKPLLSNPDNKNVTVLAESVIKYVYEKAFHQNECQQFDGVTITVPSSTIENDTRWERMSEIMDSLRIDHYSIIKEPEAAGYYILSEALKNNTLNEGEIILVYDFGGGTFDPALIEVKSKTLRIIGEWDFNKGREIGGVYIDNIIRRDIIDSVDLFQEEVIDFFSSIPRDESGRPIIDTSNKQFMRDYRNAFTYRDQLSQLQVAAKHFFSESESSGYFKETPTYSYSLSREDYYDLISSTINETIICCDDLVSRYGGWNIVSKVILVGGSSLIPLVRERLQEKKDAEDLNYEIYYPNDLGGIDNSILYAVSIGASMFEALQPSRDERIAFGKQALLKRDYSEAEYQFSKAQSLYWQAIMLYEGLNQKPNFRKVHDLFYERFSLDLKPQQYTKDDLSLLILHEYMLFKGEGMKKNDQKLLEEISPFVTAFTTQPILLDILALFIKNPMNNMLSNPLIEKLLLLQKAASGEACQDDYKVLYDGAFYKL